jgi:hypothetical protein
MIGGSGYFLLAHSQIVPRLIFLQTLVTVALVVDGLSFIGDYICVYEYTITHAGMSQNHLPPLV